MRSLWPRQCMRIHGTCADATALAIVGSARPPKTWWTPLPPASTAASATAARVVSMLTHTPAATSSRTTGSTLASSASGSTRGAPGRVDSPPTSTRSAPASRIPTPWATARSRSSHWPPSENESGVTLRTPITTHRPGSGSPPAIGSTVPDQREHLRAGGRRRPEHPAHGRRGGARAGLADPPHAHAEVLGLDHHDHALRFQLAHQGVGHLSREPFLHLRPPRVQVDEPGDLPHPGDPPLGVRDVTDVRHTVERDQVVLAHGEHRDVLDQDQLLVVLVERAVEHLVRLGVEPLEDLRVRPGHPGRRVPQAFAVGILPDRDQQL